MFRLAEYCNRLSVPKLIFVLNCAMCRWFLWYYQYLLMVLNISRKPESTVAWSNLVWWKLIVTPFLMKSGTYMIIVETSFFPVLAGSNYSEINFYCFVIERIFVLFLGGSKVIHFSWKCFLVIKIFWSCESFLSICNSKNKSCHLYDHLYNLFRMYHLELNDFQKIFWYSKSLNFSSQLTSSLIFPFHRQHSLICYSLASFDSAIFWYISKKR